MDSNEIRSILKDLDLTQVAAAGLCGVEDRTLRRWIEKPYTMPLTAVETLYCWQYFERVEHIWPLYKLH